MVRQPARLQAMVNGWLRKSINHPDSCVGLKIPTSQDGVYRVSVRCIIMLITSGVCASSSLCDACRAA